MDSKLLLASPKSQFSHRKAGLVTEFFPPRHASYVIDPHKIPRRKYSHLHFTDGGVEALTPGARPHRNTVLLAHFSWKPGHTKAGLPSSSHFIQEEPEARALEGRAARAPGPVLLALGYLSVSLCLILRKNLLSTLTCAESSRLKSRL